jgi:hypothetical protein
MDDQKKACAQGLGCAFGQGASLSISAGLTTEPTMAAV